MYCVVCGSGRVEGISNTNSAAAAASSDRPLPRYGRSAASAVQKAGLEDEDAGSTQRHHVMKERAMRQTSHFQTKEAAPAENESRWTAPKGTAIPRSGAGYQSLVTRRTTSCRWAGAAAAAPTTRRTITIPIRHEHEMQVVDDTAGGENSTHLDASNTNDDNDENIEGSDGDGSSSSSGFVIPTARPLVLDYEHAEVHTAASGGGTQRRRKGHHHQEQQQQSDHQSQSQHPPTQPPSRIRRRSTHTSSILLNPLHVFGTFTVVAYLMRPNSSQISSTPGTDADASFGSAKFYDDPWDQGEDFRDRSPIPDELKRKQARTENALAAKRKKMEEEEEARRKNATSSADDEGKDEVEGVEGPGGDDKEEETPGEETLSEETSGANETKSETEANVTSINITSFEAIVDPFPQLYDWQNWTTRLANETKTETFATDPIFLWFAPQSGGGAFVKILEDCYEGINITRSQWWRFETPDDADAIDSANAGANSWWWQYDTAPLDDASPSEDGRLPIMATTNLLEAASSAFNSSAGRGRCISLFMHPIERAIRSYHHHRMISSRTAKSNASATSNSTSNITLESYAQGPFAEENRLVRSIADRNSSEDLQWEDLEAAMDFCHAQMFGRDHWGQAQSPHSNSCPHRSGAWVDQKGTQFYTLHRGTN